MDDSTKPPQHSREPAAEPAAGSSLSARETERASLRLLRDHVTRAVEEIVRLRAQNKSLARRLAEFEASSGAASQIFDEEFDVNKMKSKISSFVSSIDTYLAESEEG